MLKDKIVQGLIDSEFKRQTDELEMIASENYVSKEVMMAYSNVYTNKYSEGTPLSRYYGGQINVDRLEILTQYRALRIFDVIPDSPDFENMVMNGDLQQAQNIIESNSWGVNVQPLSGSPANLAVYLGCLKTHDTILGMSLDTGGHLSHGHPLNASGIYYNIVAYGVSKDDFLIDYDEVEQKALESKPALILAGFSCYPRDLDWEKFSKIADKVEQIHGYRPLLMADIAHIAGLIAGKQLKGPFEHFDIVTTTTHKTLRGPRGAVIYYKQGKLNRNGAEMNLRVKINKGVFPGLQGGPHDHVCVAKCIAFGEILTSDYQEYARKVIENARALAQELVNMGWNVITGGTDNHIVWMDVTNKEGIEINMSGKKAEKTLDEIGISINKNMIPFDKNPPLKPSGIRLGTPALTTRGLGVQEIKLIAKIINDALINPEDDTIISDCKNKVKEICNRFPLQY